MTTRPAELLDALVAHPTMQEMRSTRSRARLALANSTLPQQQEPDGGQHHFKIRTRGPAIGGRQAL
jgi:hypothetical protein